MSFWRMLTGFWKPRHPVWRDPGQALVYETGLRLMAQSEENFLRSLGQMRNGCSCDKGRYQARLFGMQFAVSAMTLAWGAARHADSEAVYRALLRTARRGLTVPAEQAASLAEETLREQSRALISEKNNVGAGQFALASVFESALEKALGPLWKLPETEAAALPAILGAAVAAPLGEWAGLYKELSGQEMQTYQLGFRKSSRDSRPFADGGQG